MSAMKIQIDGKWVEAYPDETILDVARRNNIHIPTLCHDDQLEPYTSCFLCVVQVEGARTLQPSCATKVRDGMVVRTQSDEIEKSRKMALELLLSNHFADCLGPCKISCPAGVDVQGYVALAAMGKYKEAIQLIKEKNPLPTVCGRVCTRPCELNCRRNIIDEGVAVDDIKRFVADIDLFSEDRYFPEVKPRRRERIAIVGSGPAGLSCAYYLSIEGYHVDIFEAREKAGGMLRYGIPQYRLPEEILDKEIEGILNLGVNLYTNKALGKDFTLEDLFKDGYKAIFLALGAQKSTHIHIEGEDLDGVMAGIEFLAQVKAGDVKRLNGTVAVIGGGNTAVDAARTALRLGAKKVYMIYRRTIKEMPANPEEIEAAQHEGVEILFLSNPKRYLGNNGKLTGIECIKMKLGEPDESGRRRPVPVEGSDFEVAVDYVIEAIGQKPDFHGLPVQGDHNPKGFKVTRWGTLETDPLTYMTSVPGVFAAGDVVLGPATAIEAIAGGRKVANGIHHFITGKWIEDIKTPFVSRRDHFRTLTPKDYLKVDSKPRHKRPELDPKERIKSFEEVEGTFKEEDVLDEAIRCLECGCKAFFDCDLQKYATDYQADQTAFIGDFHEYEIDDRHPFIHFDLNKCILCGRCVRTCEEVVGVSALGLVNRGFATKIAPALEKPLQETACITCGLCVDTCPTGAITDELFTPKPGPWKTEKKTVLCDYCSVGCDRQAHLVGGQIIRMDSPENGRANPFGNLCFKGRFGYEYLYTNQRITTPKIKKDGVWKDVDYAEALEYIGEKILDLKGTHEVYVSGKLALEDFYQIQKFSRLVLKTNKIGTISTTLFKFFDEFPMILNTGLIKEITLSENVVVLKTDFIKTHPVVHYELTKAVKKGANVIALSADKPQIGKNAKWYQLKENDLTSVLKGIVKEIISSETYNKICDYQNPEFMEYVKKELQNFTIDQISALTSEEFDTIRQIFLSRAENFVITNLADLSPEEMKWFLILQSLVKNTQVKTLALDFPLSMIGHWLMGIHPNLAPGGRKLEDSLDHLQKIWYDEISFSNINEKLSLLDDSEEPDIIWIFGEDPVGTSNSEKVKQLFEKIQLKIVFDSIWTETAEAADVVFPMLPVEEAGGIFLNGEGQFLLSEKIVETSANTSMIATLANISRKLEYFLMPESLEAVRGDIARLLPWFDEILKKVSAGEHVTILDIAKNFEFRLAQPVGKKVEPLNQYEYGGDGLIKWIYEFAREQGLKQI
jgi:formate dehydrogenase major subunit